MFHDLLNLFYPEICQICENILVKNEQIICTSCLHELPVIDFQEENENLLKKVFYGRMEVEEATALLLFHKKGSVQKLIHQLKYKGHKEIGGFLGKWLGSEMINSGKFCSVDAVIPVPLHKKKLRTRGYNQVDDFGTQIAKALDVPYLDKVLLKTSFSTTQTIKARLARWGNIEETFVLANPERIQNLHLLLVDDIITTGATLEACASVLKEAGGIKISIATMAVAG
jgi:ComF family protein